MKSCREFVRFHNLFCPLKSALHRSKPPPPITSFVPHVLIYIWAHTESWDAISRLSGHFVPILDSDEYEEQIEDFVDIISVCKSDFPGRIVSTMASLFNERRAEEKDICLMTTLLGLVRDHLPHYLSEAQLRCLTLSAMGSCQYHLSHAQPKVARRTIWSVLHSIKYVKRYSTFRMNVLSSFEQQTVGSFK